MTTDAKSPAGASGDALDANVRLARLRRQMFARVETPRIAQYHVLRQIGGGGMGLVFAAWDPSLDRVVAIKVLRDSGSDLAAVHLRREAIALARLRHPNVVSVFEVGDHEDQVYIAMEYVEGQTLRDWLRDWRAAPKRNMDQLIDVFQQAALGLAAAHAKGLVHRDVKPENIMIEEDGRVRLMDFGLAHARPHEDVSTEADLDMADAPPALEPVTDGLLGTPAYMAPEQFDGRSPGPASDQFALCLCLFEALYGRRARPGRMAAAAVVSVERVEIPAERGVPRRLQALLRRGLQLDPLERFPTMEVFAERLRRSRKSYRQRWIAAGSVSVAVAGVVGGYAVAATKDAVCKGSEEHLAGVWDQARAASIESNLVEAPFADTAWKLIVPELDAYRERWIEGHEAVCRAAQVKREITPEMMDLQMACLRERKRHLAALVDVVETGDRSTLANADFAVASLPAIERCRDPEYVEHQGYRKDPTEVSEQIADRLAVAAARFASGDRLGAKAVAEEALSQARAVADDAGVARAELVLGRSNASLGEILEGRDHLTEAYDQARRLGMVDVATEAAIILVRVVAMDLARMDEASWWLRLAEIEAEQIDDPHLRGTLELAAAVLLNEQGRGAQGLARASTAVDELRDAVGPTDRFYLEAQRELGWLYYNNGDPKRGRGLLQAAATATRETLGENHPANADHERMLAFADRIDGNLEGSIEHARRALALTESVLGPRHIRLAGYLESLANSVSQTGAHEEALALLDRALTLDRPRPISGVALATIYDRRGQTLMPFDSQKSYESFRRAYEIAREVLGEQHRTTVRYRVGAAVALVELRRLDEGTQELLIALTIGQTALGETHPDVGYMHGQLGWAYEVKGDIEKSLEYNEKALELMLIAHGEDSYTVAPYYTNVCSSLVQLERAEQALEPCSRAFALADGAVGTDVRTKGLLRNNYAAALMGVGRLEDGVRELEAARRMYQAELGPDSYDESIVVFNLGEAAELAGDCRKAKPLYAKALEIREAELGAEHPATDKPRDRLAKCGELESAP